MTNHAIPFDSRQAFPTEELSGLRLQLRSDLRFTLQKFGGVVCYVVEDPVHSAFYRIGPAEYAFLSLLNGINTVSDVLAKTAVALGSDAISEAEAITICRWLTDHHLAVTSQSVHGRRFSQLQKSSESTRWKAWLNPLSTTISLGNPVRVLQRLLTVCRGCFGVSGWLIWFIILGLGLLRLLIDSHSLSRDAAPAIAPDNWIWLGLVWLGLKLVHEVSHGLCCLKYGGSVRSFGLNLVLFVPLPFVDTSAAWRLPSRWQRMHVAFAGIYAELALAALAASIRSYSDNEVLRSLCLNVMLTGGVLTLLFNLNPLSRYDGYYILADWLELPNLAQSAQRIVVQLIKRVLFGVRLTSELPRRQWLSLAVYGILAAVWRLTVSISMIFAAERLFHGAGAPLAIIAAILWFGLPAWHAVRYVVTGNLKERPSRLRCVLIATSAGVAFVMIGQRVIWPEELVLPAVVDFVPAETVRCRVSGFVREVHVRPGQTVRPGERILTLSNPETDFGAAEIEIEIQQTELRHALFRSRGEIASSQAELAVLESLRQKQEEQRRLQECLIVTSPVSGMIIAADLNNLPGQFLRPGDAVCVVGNTAEKCIRVMIPQDQAASVSGQVGQSVTIRFRGDSTRQFSGILESPDPRASDELLHPALAATLGGPISVRAAATEGQTTENQWILTTPHFPARVRLPDELRDRCGAGQLATVHLSLRNVTLADRLRKGAARWMQATRERVDVQ